MRAGGRSLEANLEAERSGEERQFQTGAKANKPTVGDVLHETQVRGGADDA